MKRQPILIVSNIFVDISSGDNAPQAQLQAVIEFANLNPDICVHAVGLADAITSGLPANCQFTPVDSVIKMSDSAATALRMGRNTSMWRAMELLSKCDEPAAMISSGNTAAMIALSKHTIGMKSSLLKRPALLSRIIGSNVYCSDLGANLSLSPAQLHQLALTCMDHIPIDNPKVAIINIASEAEKGPEVLKEAYHLFEKDAHFFQRFLNKVRVLLFLCIQHLFLKSLIQEKVF